MRQEFGYGEEAKSSAEPLQGHVYRRNHWLPIMLRDILHTSANAIVENNNTARFDLVHQSVCHPGGLPRPPVLGDSVAHDNRISEQECIAPRRHGLMPIRRPEQSEAAIRNNGMGTVADLLPTLTRTNQRKRRMVPRVVGKGVTTLHDLPRDMRVLS